MVGRVKLAIAVTVTVSACSGSAEVREQPREEVSVNDHDGNEYRIAKIGDQIWMAENLRTSRYRDGTAIPKRQDDESWSTAGEGAYCVAEDGDTNYESTYGFLYNFSAVANSRGLCPEGWHIPSESECRALIDHLGGGELAGGKIKDNSSSLWIAEPEEASNESGFSGLPAGGRGRFGSPGEVGYYATWWSSTLHDSKYAWHWGLYPDSRRIRANPGHIASGLSVRCIKDSSAARSGPGRS